MVPVPTSVPGETVPTVPVSGSSSLAAPSCFFARADRAHVPHFPLLWLRFCCFSCVLHARRRSACSVYSMDLLDILNQHEENSDDWLCEGWL